MLRLGTLVVCLGEADTGLNKPVRGIVRTNSGEVEAYVKRLADPRKVLAEVICALLARRLSLSVPEPLLVFMPDQDGGKLGFGSVVVGHPNVQAWIERYEQNAVLNRLKAWKELIPAACFDEWIANCDRHRCNLLFDGNNSFWLIDHELALHESVNSAELSPLNQLFAVAVDGLVESDLLSLRPKVMGVMQTYSECNARSISVSMPTGLYWSSALLQELILWLDERQGHLLEFGNARVPAKQGDIFDGSRNA